MQEFSGLDYINIQIANSFGHGMDRENWDTRIAFANTGSTQDLRDKVDVAKEPFLYLKALKAREDALAGIPTGYIGALDATASGGQIIACLMGCEKTAARVNLINTGKREDLYDFVGKVMGMPRDVVKHPTMTTFYASLAQPKEVFEPDQLGLFYDTLREETPLCLEYLALTRSMHNPEATHYAFTLPDGFQAHVLVEDVVDKKIEVQELGKSTFTYRTTVNQAKDHDVSLAANIVQGIDGWVVREMKRKAKILGFDVLAIHDSFWCCPNWMNHLRKVYREILAELAESDLLRSIVLEITGEDIGDHKPKNNLAALIRESEYMLS